MEGQHKAKEEALITKGEFPFPLFIEIACFKSVRIVNCRLRFGYQIPNVVIKRTSALLIPVHRSELNKNIIPLADEPNELRGCVTELLVHLNSN